MLETKFGWTLPKPPATLHIDPSGVQAVSTDFQATLFPGLTTVTQNVRYLSLFAAARYYRINAETANRNLDYPTFMNRFEALIAVCSVVHHPMDAPRGIVGVNTARRKAQRETIRLHQEVLQTAYRIYRSTLGDLQILDLSRPSDPPYEGAKPLAQSWDVTGLGGLAADLRAGFLPDQLPRSQVQTIAPSFCLCGVPVDSAEQRELTKLLFCFDGNKRLPRFSPEDAFNTAGYRAVSWRLLLEIVRRSPNQPLGGSHFMTRLVDDDLLDEELPPVLRDTLRCWRWVAARTFFEVGWTYLFRVAYLLLKPIRPGLSRDQLRRDLAEEYTASNAQDEAVGAIVDDVAQNFHLPDWRLAKLTPANARDALLAMYTGLLLASQDRQRGHLAWLDQLWAEGPISLADGDAWWDECHRKSQSTREFWATGGERALIQHVRSSLAKMAAGNPDSLLVDYLDGRWLVPDKVLTVPNPELATGGSRLDVALGWALQLGLVAPQAGRFVLTGFGEETCEEWDRRYEPWQSRS